MTHITELFEVEKLSQLNNTLALTLGVSSVIIDTEDRYLTPLANHTPICDVIREGELCPADICYSMDISQASVPITLEKQDIAYWVIGEFSGVSKEKLTEYARAADVNITDMLKAYQRTKDSNFSHKVNLVNSIALQVSEQAYDRLIILRLRDDLKQAQTDKYMDRLEELVNEKVVELRGQWYVMRELSITDTLTGCYNRHYLEENLSKEFERSKRFKHYFSLMMIDIDNFKTINDTYGHLAGDQVLREFTDVVKKSMRKVDWLVRYGGDEFALVLPETTENDAYFLADRIRENIYFSGFSFEEMNIPLTASFGVSSFSPLNPKEPESMLREADQNLYRAKAYGRNRVH